MVGSHEYDMSTLNPFKRHRSHIIHIFLAQERERMNDGLITENGSTVGGVYQNR